MNRRPFLKKLTVLSSAISTMPFITFGKMHFPVNPTLKFIIASDGHYGQPNTDFKKSHHALIEAIHFEENVDFVVFNGDLIHDEPKWMPEVKNVYDTLKVPYFPVKGNHDRISETEWEEIWGIPADHAFINKEKFGVILANSSNQAGDYLCVDALFLKNKLEDFKHLSHVFIIIHISQNDWTKHGVACSEILEMIGSYSNVRAVFHGHDHDVDGIMLNRNKPYLWSGHFGGSWGSPHPGYRVCEVGEDGKTITYLKAMKDGMILSGHTI